MHISISLLYNIYLFIRSPSDEPSRFRNFRQPMNASAGTDANVGFWSRHQLPAPGSSLIPAEMLQHFSQRAHKAAGNPWLRLRADARKHQKTHFMEREGESLVRGGAVTASTPPHIKDNQPDSPLSLRGGFTAGDPSSAAA